MDWMAVAERLGVPAAMLAAIVFGAWRVIQYLLRRLFNGDGLVTRFFNAHLEQMRENGADLKAQTGLLAELKTGQDASHRAQEAFSQLATGLSSRNRLMHLRLAEMHARCYRELGAEGGATMQEAVQRLLEDDGDSGNGSGKMGRDII